MENPNDKIHNELLSRINANMERLNGAVTEVNQSLLDVNAANRDNEVVSQMWQNYMRAANYNVERTGQKSEPI